LTVGWAAWEIWGNKAETATSKARKSAEDAQAALDRLRDRKQYGEDELAPVRKGIAELEAALAEMKRTEIQWDPETGEPREVRGYSDRDIQAAQARLDKMRQDLANAQQELAGQAQGLAGTAASGVTNIMESAFARLEQGYKDKLDPLAAELEKLKKAAAEAGISTDSDRYKQAEQLARDTFAKKSDTNVSIGDVGKQLRDKTVKAIKDGVQYEFGAKNLSSLVIDCSGFVTALHAPVVKGIVEAQKGALPEDIVAALKSSSDGIITNIANITGDLVKTKANALDFSRLREGMLIGIDTGVTDFEKEEKPGTRTYGIDHIVSLVKDELGTLMVGESSGGKGVHWTPAEEWAKRFGDSVKAFAVDPYKNLRLPWETLGNYAKQVNEVEDILTRS
ncbi:hypothetical protein, partial [Megalodesulfovibrio gigas]|uniref:hypothetical protein n=1 Tax=Megalodesulfovibrio gigas TaxID=879 RepID=UPI001B7FBB18